jgi:hypothetical protein
VLSRGGAALSSPKLAASERRDSLFPYYAGFSTAFVSDVLDALQVTTGQIILDPWNGSGTTTAVASSLGVDAIGIDLNPALAIVAKARLASSKDAERASELLRCAGSKLSVQFLRKTCSSAVDSRTRSLLLLAVFRLTRRRLSARDLRATNPTWWSLGLADVKTAVTSLTRSHVERELEEIRKRLSPRKRGCGTVRLVQSDLLITKPLKKPADIIVTSPPYLTRIDYVKATLPELLVLSLIENVQIEQMRRAMIGSPVIGRGPDQVPVQIGEHAKAALTRICRHQSKASSSYYLAFFTTYITKIVSALERLSDLTMPSAKLVLVVQGSHYKEVFVDLAQLFIELSAGAGFSFVSRADFHFKQSFAQLNPKANGYSLDTARESALFFEKSP